jgi:hypothetical protein
MSALAEALYRLNERASIAEFDGQATRAESEHLAIEELEADASFGPGVKRQAIRIFREQIEERTANSATPKGAA